MDVKAECLKAIAAGTTAASIARKADYDPTTLNKWLKNKRNLSKDAETAVRQALLEIKAQWMEIAND